MPPWSHLCSNKLWSIFLSQTILGLRANWAAIILTKATRSLCPGSISVGAVGHCGAFGKMMHSALLTGCIQHHSANVALEPPSSDSALAYTFISFIQHVHTCSIMFISIVHLFLLAKRLNCFSKDFPSFPASKSEVLHLQRRQRQLWDMAVVPADGWPQPRMP